MLKLTPSAAEQVSQSIAHSGASGLALRIAARRRADASIEYIMGLDEAHEGDTRLTLEGVEVLVAPEHKELLQGTTLDFGEINPGEPVFIFSNPNDPAYVPPQAH